MRGLGVGGVGSSPYGKYGEPEKKKQRNKLGIIYHQKYLIKENESLHNKFN